MTTKYTFFLPVQPVQVCILPVQRTGGLVSGLAYDPKSQLNCTERLHVDATIMRSFQTELFSSFLPSMCAGHVNLAASKHWHNGSSCQTGKNGSTVVFIIFCVKDFVSAVSYTMIIL